MDTGSFEMGKDLISLAKEVLKNYNIVPDNISVIQSGTIKTVWKIKTQNSLYCLKRLKQSYDKALFSVNAQIYIKQSGGKVAAVIPDKSGAPIVFHNEQLFVLYEWIHGKDLDLNNRSDLIPALHGLAEFHLVSRGYTAKGDARVSSKLGKWPEQYNSMRNKFLVWKSEAAKKASLSYHSSYLKSVDPIIEIADKAMELLNRSSYTQLTSPGSDRIVLCHQDFGKGNALLTEKGVFVLDLDGVTYDLAARDLRKITGKDAENRNRWDADSVTGILEAYEKFNPMSQQERDVLYIDLLFPHWFYGLLKNLYLNGKTLKPGEIERIAKLEQTKVPLLNSLLKRSK